MCAQRTQTEIHARYPAYYSALRLGRNLKERCTRSDPERWQLQNMLDALADAWGALQSLAAQK